MHTYIYIYACVDSHALAKACDAHIMHRGAPAGAHEQGGSCLNYGYMCMFLVQLFVLVACGSYVNVAIVCVSWSIVLMSTHEHGIIICMLCAISVVLQTYALSINSQQVLLVSSPRQRACETIGISRIESLYRLNNVFKSCNADLLIPFIPRTSYSLQRDAEIKLMYGESVSPTTPMRFATCQALGVSCYRWKIHVQGFGVRFFEPCWSLVRNVLVTNASAVHMVHRHTHSSETHVLNASVGPTTPDSRFIHISSSVRNPVTIVRTQTLDLQALSAVSYAPDADTFFVVMPKNAGQQTSMQIAMSIQCEAEDRGSAMLGDDVPFFHSGVTHLAAAATPMEYTVYSAFSECSRADGGSGCNSRLLTSFSVYISNILLCLSCILLTHTCGGIDTNEHSVVHIFALVTAIVTFNWVVIVCIYFVHPTSLHGGIGNLRRPFQLLFYLLHVTQLGLLVTELVRNQLGNNVQFIMARMHAQYSVWQLLLPFTLLDSNIYIENCALYLGSSLFVVYLLYFKSTR